MVDVDTKPHSLPHTSVSVGYNCLLGDDASSRPEGPRAMTAKSSMTEWLYPLCDLHKRFDNLKMLERYITLSLTIQDSHPEPQLVITRQVPIRELSASEPSSDSRHVERNMGYNSDEKTLVHSSSTPYGTRSKPGSRLVSTPSIAEEDFKPTFDTSGYWTRHSSLSGHSASQALLGDHDTQDSLGPSILARVR